MTQVLYKEFHVTTAKVLNRPSKTIKTPYVADICLTKSEFEDKNKCLAHTPSLGCNGMVDTNATVFIVQKDSKSKAHCKYTVIASLQSEKEQEYVVGVEPIIGEKLGHDILLEGIVPKLKAKILDKQFTYEDCRFDFKGITTANEPFICEVKNVSIAVYENIRPSKMKKKDYTAYDIGSKIGIFPSGFKPEGQTHSERAVKQTRRLTEIKKKYPEVRCLILYVIQRDDIMSFHISKGDQIYLEAIKEAVNANVEIAAVSISWIASEANSILTPRVHNNSLKVYLGDSI